MAILILILSNILGITLLVLFANRVADYQFPKELELGWQSKQEKKKEKLLSKLSILRLDKTYSGAPKIILAEKNGYLGFEKISMKFIRATDSKIETKAENPMERVWTVKVNEISCCLSWDDLSKDVSIFAWEPSGNEKIEKLFKKIMELQIRANAKI